MKRYNPTDIEQKWQAIWEKEGTYTVDLTDHSKPKYYGMGMLPGITGAGIHIGHGRTYQFSDIKVRAKRQQGYNAYNPIGWDSFGLPVENYAIKVGKKPREAHDEAKVNFKTQLKRLGYSYDWSKEISTADPSYYKWTQWIFNKLYEHGLAYQKESPQWWCETDQTVLANEQVEGGKCWRCGNPVVKKNLKQWFFKITEYADDILAATDDLNWSDSVKTMQKNWIGKSQGADIEFTVDGRSEIISVFTTRPDTLFGATFLVLAPEHPLARRLANIDTEEAVEAYIVEAARKSEIERMNESREKTGVFTGSYALNPATGDKIPIWLADYVLAGYGTGAIMAVPAHDERDFMFAETFHLPIKQVVAPETGNKRENETIAEGGCAVVFDPNTQKYAFARLETGSTNFFAGGVGPEEDLHKGILREVEEESGLTDITHVEEIGVAYAHYRNVLKKTNRIAKATSLLVILNSAHTVETKLEAHEKFHLVWLSAEEVLKQWQASENRDYDHYILFLQHGVARAMKLGYDTTSNPALFKAAAIDGEGILVQSGQFDGMRTEEAREEIVAWLEEQGVGRARVTYKMRDWLISRQRYWGAPIPIIHCDEHGAVAVPDDQLPVVLPDVEEYKPQGGATSVLATVTDWVNTACPVCGKPAKRETDTMDGYACSSWYFLRYLDPHNDQQAWNPDIEAHWGPIDFYNGADHAVAHLLYARFWMRFFYKLGLVSNPEPFKRMMYNAYIMAPDGRKMSKSLGNVIDPLEIMNSGYGADALRLYEMFIAPYDIEAPWDIRGVPGTYRFLNRVWNLTQEYIESPQAGESEVNDILRIAHKTVKKVTEDIEDEKFNTAISTMMETVNAYYKLKESHAITKTSSWQFAIESLLQVLAPFAPHITEELWHQLGHEKTIHIDTWPLWDNAYLQTSDMTIVIQVNGKRRAELTVALDATKDAITKQALTEKNVATFLQNKPPVKVVYVPGKLLNIVV